MLDAFFIFRQFFAILLHFTQVFLYPIDYTLNRLEEMLDPSCFFRVNRQYISAIESIKQIIFHSNSRMKIVFHGTPPEKEDIIISRENVEKFKTWLGR